ncbi:MAG: hypothetical protein FWD38_04700 [Oscillospiraceae bacterium]|nr:hypothetical protein [Oscillospiraceae bacterium]
MQEISTKDKNILRELAKKKKELAASPAISKLRSEWKLHGDFNKASRPMVLIEAGTFENDYLPQMLECEGETARSLEKELLRETVNHTHFGDDTIVKDYIPVTPNISFVPFNIEVKKEHASYENGTASLGHHFVPAISDLEKDFYKLGKSKFTLDKNSIQKDINIRNDVYGDILTVKQTGFSLYCCLTQDIVHIMDMENMYSEMCINPELFNMMMTNLTDDYLELYRLLETEGALLPTYDECHLSQGSYCFNNELPRELPKTGTTLKTNEIWGYMDSQEAAGISPEMFMELVAPHYKRIIEKFGLLSYGCCEKVDPVWDSFLSKLGNLRKVSISPWADESFMGERLRNKNIVYMRKPTPNLLGVGANLDEQAAEKHIMKTIDAAKGCWLEIIQRDVYKLNNTTDKVKKYVDIVRRCCDKHIN